MIYYLTLFPAILGLCREYGCEGVMVMEDTCILMRDVDYDEVRREVQNYRAGVFGYGSRWLKTAKWSGTAPRLCT